tara:strand:- start:121 stop:861 length:741 start_codon:yes stop_codon:yes gene_type:complete
MFVTLATGLGREGISGEIYFRRKSSIKPRPHFTHNLTKPCHAPSRPQHTLTSADMPKNRDRRGPKIIGKNLNPNKPISIVLCSVYMLGVDPSKLQGLGSDSEYDRQYEKMLDDTRGIMQHALNTLNTKKRLKKTTIEVRGPKFFAFPDIKELEDIQKSDDFMEQMRTMCKTVIHVKQETRQRVYGLDVMGFHPDLGVEDADVDQDLYRIVDPYDKVMQAQAEKASGDVIDFGCEDEDEAGSAAAEP